MRSLMAPRARRGGILMIVAAGMTTLVGFGALVCDVGLAFAQRTRMQTAADAAALAAAAHLASSQSRAKLEAITIAKLNGYNIKGTDVAFDKGNKQVTVAWKEHTGFVLGPVLDRMGVQVGVSASAIVEKSGERLPVVPFLVKRDPNAKKGTMIDIKVGAGDGYKGNYGAAAIDGPGAKIYKESIIHGARTPIQIGSFVDFEPGNINGPTDAGVAERIKDDTVGFDDATKVPTKRLIVVPLVEDYTQEGDFKGRSKPIMVRGFARMYLVSSENAVVKALWIDENPLTDVPTGGEKPRPKLVR